MTAPNIVYFSSVSGNTDRFVRKLTLARPELSSERIPLRTPTLQATAPYVLIVPTYGGGTEGGAVPKQVIRFLNDAPNRALIVGVVSCGNTNFGAHYCRAGDIISEKTGAPHLDRVEVFGTPEDVERVATLIAELR